MSGPGWSRAVTPTRCRPGLSPAAQTINSPRSANSRRSSTSTSADRPAPAPRPRPSVPVAARTPLRRPSPSPVNANGCRGLLHTIHKVGEETPRWNGNNVTLTFAPSQGPDWDNKTIIAGHYEYLDLIFLDFANDDFRCVGQMGVRNWPQDWPQPYVEDIFKDEGEYLLSGLVTASSINPLPFTFKFRFIKRRGASTGELVMISI